MSPKSVICCLAATAFVATTALMPNGAFAGGRGGGANWPQPGIWNWPPYAEGGNMPLHYDHRYHHCWWRHCYRHSSKLRPSQANYTRRPTLAEGFTNFNACAALTFRFNGLAMLAAMRRAGLVAREWTPRAIARARRKMLTCKAQ